MSQLSVAQRAFLRALTRMPEEGPHIANKIADLASTLYGAEYNHKELPKTISDTILYLLEEKGPLTTLELHPLIQQIHPDLCDDTIDRVIEGVHFGKKWKHYVRNAQQYLKRQDIIGFNGQRWFRRS